MAKQNRQYVTLDWNAPGALRAEDIPYSASESIKSKLDSLQSSVTNIEINCCDGGSGSGETGGGSGSPPVIYIYPSMMALDTAATGVDRGDIFGIIESVDFEPGTDGAIWYNFECSEIADYAVAISSSLSISQDFVFSLNGSDDNKVIALVADVYVINDGQAPTLNSPDHSYTTNITSTAALTGTKNTETFSYTISPGEYSEDTTIAIRLRRDVSVANNYGGTFQLSKIIAYTSAL